MYPSDKHPVHGIFIKEQIEDLTKNHDFIYEIFLIESVHKSKLEYFKSVLNIYRYIDRFKPDIIHIHYGLSGFFLLFFKPKTDVFLTLHGSDFNNRGSNYLQVWLSRRIISKADLVFVQNPTMKKQALKYNQNVEVLTCGVDTNFFNPENIIKNLTDEKLILFPSSPTREVKNYPLFLQVINELEALNNYKIKIILLENVTRREVKEKMLQADCLLMTSKTEGSPQSIKEALSCGLSIVSVPVGDVEEMIQDIPNCYISASHNAKELAKLVDKTLKNDNKGIREAFLIKKQFTNTTISKKLANFYNIELK